MGKDGQGKALIVLWSTGQAVSTGNVSVLAKAHTDAAVHRMRIAAFDDHRYVRTYSLSD